MQPRKAVMHCSELANQVHAVRGYRHLEGQYHLFACMTTFILGFKMSGSISQFFGIGVKTFLNNRLVLSHLQPHLNITPVLIGSR